MPLWCAPWALPRFWVVFAPRSPGRRGLNRLRNGLASLWRRPLPPPLLRPWSALLQVPTRRRCRPCCDGVRRAIHRTLIPRLLRRISAAFAPLAPRSLSYVYFSGQVVFRRRLPTPLLCFIFFTLLGFCLGMTVFL